jgi:hypothetical protein
MQIKKPHLGQLLFLTFMVTGFFLADDQSGPWLLVIPGIVYWALYRVRDRFISSTPAT